MDVGNLCANPSPGGDVKTKALIDGMNRLGYRVANVGERDLAQGYPTFADWTGKAKFPFISANIVDRESGKTVFPPYEIVEVERQGKKIRLGVIGVVRFNPVFLKEGPAGSQVKIVPPIQAIEKQLSELQGKVDMTVVLAGLHRDEAKLIAERVKGIDLILGSFGGIYSSREDEVGETVVYYSGNQGKRLAETRLFLDGGGKLADTTSFQHYLTARYPEDKPMQGFVGDALVRVEAAGGKPVASGPASPSSSAR